MTIDRRKQLTVPAREPVGPPPRVTVIITNYNYARYLRASVDSALGQRGVDCDVVLVDDASTDGSVHLARSMQRAHPRLQTVEHRQNRGPVASFNAGLDRARGEFVVRLDADDLLTPGSLARAAAAARAFPSAGLVYGHPLKFSGSALPQYRHNARAWTLWPGDAWVADRCRTGMNVITSPEVLVRRSVLTEVGPMAALAHTHDMELWMRIAAASDVVFIRGADQAWHREHEQSLSARAVSPLVDLGERLAAFRTLFAGRGAALPGAVALLGAAELAIAEDAVERVRQLLAHGAVDASVAEPYLSLAADAVVDVSRVPGWAEVQSRLGGGGSAGGAFRSVAERLVRRLRVRRRWRQLRATGTFR